MIICDICENWLWLLKLSSRFNNAEQLSKLSVYKLLRIVSISGRHLAADAMERGEDVTMYASMLKLKVGRLLREVTDACVQFWGGMGYSDDVYVSR